MADERINPFCEELPDHVEGSPDDGSSAVARRRRGRPPGARNKLGRGTKGTARDLLHPLIPGARKRLKAILKDPKIEPELAVKVIALLLDRCYGRPIESSRILADIDQRTTTTTPGMAVENGRFTTPVPAAHRILSTFNMARHEAANAGLMAPLDEYDADRPADVRVVEAALAYALPDGSFTANPAVVNIAPNGNDIELLAELLGAPKRAGGPYESIMDAEFAALPDHTGAKVAADGRVARGAEPPSTSAAIEPSAFSPENSDGESAPPQNSDTPTSKYPTPPGHRIVEKFSDRVVMTTDENHAINTVFGVREITPGVWGWRFIQAGSPEMLEHLRLRGREESIRGEYADPVQ